jgi:hypothetical protein
MRRLVRQPRKRCPQCGERKSRDLFNKNRAQADGLQTRCRMCEHGIEQRTCPDCGIALQGRQARCDEHQGQYEARQAAQQEHGCQAREAAAARKLADEQARSSRRCAECGGPISPDRNMGALYCGDGCRDVVSKRRQQESHAAARRIVARSCEDCGADITERATQHPLATRCESCQKTHRSGRKRPRRKVTRLCTSCGASITGRAKVKTVCVACEPKPPRLCIGCGEVDLRGAARWRCDECQAEWDAGTGARMRQWQKANPLKVQLWERRRWALDHGFAFEITLADLEQLWPDDNCCPICGAGFTRQHGCATNGSIDRINNDLGYVAGNVHICCVGCNGWKSNHTFAELAAGAAGSTGSVGQSIRWRPSRLVPEPGSRA